MHEDKKEGKEGKKGIIGRDQRLEDAIKTATVPLNGQHDTSKLERFARNMIKTITSGIKKEGTTPVEYLADIQRAMMELEGLKLRAFKYFSNKSSWFESEETQIPVNVFKDKDDLERKKEYREIFYKGYLDPINAKLKKLKETRTLCAKNCNLTAPVPDTYKIPVTWEEEYQNLKNRKHSNAIESGVIGTALERSGRALELFITEGSRSNEAMAQALANTLKANPSDIADLNEAMQLAQKKHTDKKIELKQDSRWKVTSAICNGVKALTGGISDNFGDLVKLGIMWAGIGYACMTVYPQFGSVMTGRNQNANLPPEQKPAAEILSNLLYRIAFFEIPTMWRVYRACKNKYQQQQQAKRVETSNQSVEIPQMQKITAKEMEQNTSPDKEFISALKNRYPDQLKVLHKDLSILVNQFFPFADQKLQ